MAHKFKPQNWERLLSASRRALLNPDRFLALLDIPPGSVVADLGAGPGFFTVPLARCVGPSGRVHALDVSSEMVEHLNAQHLPPQVEVLLSGETTLPLETASIDLALLAFVLHELDHPQAFLMEVRRIIKPSGRLVVLEWVPQVEELGPPIGERISADVSARTLSDAGFVVSTTGIANASNYYHVASPALA